MPLASSITPDSRFMGLFIGRSGSGKSAAAYSFPKPLHVIDLDSRIRGGLVPWIDREGISYTPINPKPTKGTVFEALNNEFGIMQINLREHPGSIKTLVLDSITWETIDLLLDAIPLTHSGQGGSEKGRTLGTLQMAGPEDYKFQSTGTYQTLAFLKSLPIPNVIVTAHIVNKYEKNPQDKYGAAVIVGEQLSLTDKLSENIPSSFDHIFRFQKEDTGSGLRFTFEAQGELARSAYPELSYGKMDITGKDFYKLLMSRVKAKETINA